ncbi:MAG: hypothetical protein KF695_10855 [Simplicispira sp.]|jgi:hypothetical protein|nr:hypothetical protein [Simplicispira sp.]
MTIITNIKLNNTRVNPNIHPSRCFARLFSGAFAMSTLAHSPVVRPASAARSGTTLVARFAAWRTERRKAREDRELWALAQQDPRVMTDLLCALRRAS